MNKSLLRTVTILAFTMIVILSGCSSQIKPVRRFHVKAMVSDFKIIPDMPDATKEVEGWWFGSHDIYMNKNSGEIFADILARQLNKDITNLDIYSRTDYKYYITNKEDSLKKAYPGLSDKEIKDLLAKIPIVDFARDLQLDDVVTGKINECKTVHNRTIHWWYSLIDADVSILDAKSGTVQWKGHVRVKKNFGSQYDAMQKAAEILGNTMKKEYFYK